MTVAVDSDASSAEIVDMADKVARDEMRVDELVDGLIDPNAVDTVPPALASADEEAEEEVEDGTDGDEEEDDGGKAAAASLAQLKADALERFAIIRAAHQKAQQALTRKGSQDKGYIKLQQQISAEMMNIRFTSKVIERLCDNVRGMIESVRARERTIQEICVYKVRMPRAHFIKNFPGNEVDLAWTAVSGKTYAIQKSGDMTNWRDIRSGIVATPPENTATVTTDPAEFPCFFRIALEIPTQP